MSALATMPWLWQWQWRATTTSAPNIGPLQSVYNFTVGLPVSDLRIATEPPYAHLSTANGEYLP